LNSIGDQNCRPAYREELISFLRANRERLRDEHAATFEQNPLRVLDCKDEACREVAAEAPKMIDRLCVPCREHLDGVLEGLDAEGIKPTLVPTMVRGIDYYTRTAFEFVSQVLSQAQATLFGGGRYDGLAEALGGPHVPGVGYGMGLERVLLALQDENVVPPGDVGLDAFVIGFGEGGRSQAREAIRALRARGLASDMVDLRPLGAQLRIAARLGARFAIIIGYREAASGTVTLRRMSDGEQEELPLDQAVDRIMGQAGESR
jgi:histidyl-tRNA synthetase